MMMESRLETLHRSDNVRPYVTNAEVKVRKERVSYSGMARTTSQRGTSTLHDDPAPNVRRNNPNLSYRELVYEFISNVSGMLQSMISRDTLTARDLRFAESKIYVKQDAYRRIPPGRNPGSGGAR